MGKRLNKGRETNLTFLITLSKAQHHCYTLHCLLGLSRKGPR
jgi:hypothetical protein